MSTINRENVLAFLNAMKLVLQGSCSGNENWALSSVRDKNLETLAKLELDYDDIQDILMSLTPLDYCEGPLKDSLIAGDLWVFGKNIKGYDVYIKLKLWGDTHNQQLRVLSFHIADKKIKYYFKN